jgi:GGDEF domain-containing protein
MHKWFNIRSIWLSLATIVLILLGVTKPDLFSARIQALLDWQTLVSPALVLGLSLIPVLFVVFIYDAFLAPKSSKQISQKNKTLLELEQKLVIANEEITTLRKQLRELQLRSLVDIVTGIPNQRMWESDVKAFSNEEFARYQMIMIDLDNFREVNHKYGYEKGDEVIKHFALSIFNAMRRNENIYKNLMRPESGILPEELEDYWQNYWQRIYRKYSGGDEFIIVIAGDLNDALGFILRLDKNLLPEINKYISKNILNEEIKLSFHVGMSSWVRNESPSSILQRLQDCLRKAEISSTSRIYIHRHSPNRGDESPNINQRLAEVENQFVKPPPSA